MERFRILEHAGDGKIRAFGASLEQAFGNAALAVSSLMTDWEKIERRSERLVAVQAGDLGQLLVKFLTEVLYLSDAHGFLLGGVSDLVIESLDAGRADAADPSSPPESGSEGRPTGSPEPPPESGAGFRLAARFLGDDRPERYDLHGDVKAITYSEMKIESCACGPGAWVVQVVVDL